MTNLESQRDINSFVPKVLAGTLNFSERIYRRIPLNHALFSIIVSLTKDTAKTAQDTERMLGIPNIQRFLD